MSRYTEMLMMQAFGEMLDEMPFDKVTVSALTRRSDISHNTFYYHYNDIYDLLRVWIQKQLAPYLEPVETMGDWEPAVKAMLHQWQADERRIYHVFSSLSREQLERHVYEQSAPFFLRMISAQPGAEALREEQVRRIAEFARYIFLGFIMRFLWNRMKDDVDESVHEMAVLLKSFVTHAISDAREGKL